MVTREGLTPWPTSHPLLPSTTEPNDGMVTTRTVLNVLCSDGRALLMNRWKPELTHSGAPTPWEHHTSTPAYDTPTPRGSPSFPPVGTGRKPRGGVDPGWMTMTSYPYRDVCFPWDPLRASSSPRGRGGNPRDRTCPVGGLEGNIILWTPRRHKKLPY